MKLRLLETKFHPPRWRADNVPRPHLVARLDAGLRAGRKLALISAPAGYGKTTLAVEWLRALDGAPPAAWLTVDEGDNDPARFMAYLLAALQRAHPGLGESARSLLGLPQPPPLSTVLDELLNDLAALEGRVILALDDYHLINAPALHEALAYLLEHLPEQAQALITTRADPPLPLARLRARRQMTELRAADLRFTPQEAGEFFNRARGLELDDAAVQVLETRTEGWPAGMQLAALALPEQPDRQDFLADFGGSHRYIIDYLLDEVLRRQPPELREFLARTAALRRFNAELCQAVTGQAEAQDILARLERTNLFLTPLDEGRGWFRYHRLFADVLLAGQPPAAQSAVRRTAAEWFEAQGSPEEALAYWLEVPDFEHAARLVIRLAGDWLRVGEVQTLRGWLARLPQALVDANPDLATYQGAALLLTGAATQARLYLEQAPVSQESLPAAGRGRLLTLRAWFASTANAPQTAELAQAALDALDGDDSFFRALALLARGGAYAWEADLPASSAVFRQAWALGRQIDHPFVALGALINLVYNLLEMGQLAEAEALCETAQAVYVDARGRRLPVVGMIYAPLACIHYEKGDFETAQALAKEGIEKSARLFSETILGGDAEITLARIAFARGEPAAAYAELEAAAERARRAGVGVVAYKMGIATVELLILEKRLAEAEAQLRKLETAAEPRAAKADQIMALLRARALVARGEAQQALAALPALAQAARQDEAIRRLMSIQVTQALAHEALGQAAQARRAFETALELAAPGGYRVLFLPFPGRPTRALLAAGRDFAPALVDGVLALSGAAPPVSAPPGPQAEALVEPLTEQEARVLALLAAGKTNQEIAEALVVTLGTAKWHVHNVLQKLGVSSRTEAAARAHAEGWV